MPVVKFFARLDLDQIFLFLDGHYLDRLQTFIKKNKNSKLIISNCIPPLSASAFSLTP